MRPIKVKKGDYPYILETINFTFETYGKLMVLGVPILKLKRVNTTDLVQASVTMYLFYT